MIRQIFLITAAGGNGTAIQVLDRALTRDQYVTRGGKLGKDLEVDGAEQAGFLIPVDSHFEMAGGEYCGNASRAAALLFSELQMQPEVNFTVSGFDGTVTGVIEKKQEGIYFVRCIFPGMPTQHKAVVLSNGQHADVIDLGGIIHVVIEGAFPDEPNAYESAHRAITKELGLQARGAVGVVWYERNGSVVNMHPVVWVKEVNTFFYEDSCGSGTIAVGKVTSLSSIIQPTGKSIEVTIGEDAVVLQSEMEITRAKD